MPILCGRRTQRYSLLWFWFFRDLLTTKLWNLLYILQEKTQTNGQSVRQTDREHNEKNLH